jgi:hypothetical protein
MPKGNNNFFHGQNYFFLEIDMAKNICKSKLWQKVDGRQLQQYVQKVGNPYPFENTYIWNRGIIHTWLPQKNKQNNYNDHKNSVILIRVCSNYHGHEKLQEDELNQGHNKEKKSQ